MTDPPIPSIGAVVRRPPPGGARKEWQQATVIEVRPETARMKTFRLRLGSEDQSHRENAPRTVHPHVPGQHMVLRLTAPDGYQAARSYSIASAPGDGTELELMVERLDDGEVSTYLHDEVRVGDELELRGPFGGWFVWNGRSPALLIGGGSGVVPLMSMLRHHRDAGLPVPLRLVVSVRTPDDLPFRGEYGDETTPIYTRQAPPRFTRPPGRIDAATLAPLLIPDSTVYVCGSAGFAEAASQLAVELGVPPERVRVERYGPTS